MCAGSDQQQSLDFKQQKQHNRNDSVMKALVEKVMCDSSAGT